MNTKSEEKNLVLARMAEESNTSTQLDLNTMMKRLAIL